MDELFEMFENKIKQSGCVRDISGEDVYNDICNYNARKLYCHV